MNDERNGNKSLFSHFSTMRECCISRIDYYWYLINTFDKCIRRWRYLNISLWSYWRFSLLREDLNGILLYLWEILLLQSLSWSFFSGKELSWGSLEIGVNIRGSFRFIERVTSFVSLPHSVDDEHDEEDGAEQADHCASYNSCKIV